MTMRLVPVLILAAAALDVTACGSSPEPVYYTMAPKEGAPRAGWAHLIELRKPALAGYLDRAEIVSRVVAYRLRIASGDSWSEPLGDMIGRLLSDDLAARLPGSLVFTELSPIAADPDAIVSLDVERFDLGEEGFVVLVAEVTVERPTSHAPVASRRLVLKMAPAGPDTASLVAAMSSLVGRLSDVVASYLRTPE